jgi:cytochrome P450
MMESILVLATIARRLRFERTSDEPVELQAAVTLRPKGALRLRPVRRA